MNSVYLSCFVGTIINIYPVYESVFKCSNCSLLTNVTVCASNNKTYESECHLAESNCVNNEKWKILHHGKCKENRTEGKGNI